MKFESIDQKESVFEAKGLETVRRDQCALTQRVLRDSLIALFRDGIDAVKEYVLKQYELVLSGHAPVSDFILTGRVRSMYRGGKQGPVQATLSRRLAEADPGRVIRHNERLPYVIVATPGANFKLKDSVLTPMELLEQWDAFTVHTAYYLSRHVNAALQRCFGLPPHKIDIGAWYDQCAKPRRRIHYWPVTQSGNSLMISTYFGSDDCALCGRKCKSSGRAKAAICGYCRRDPASASLISTSKLNSVQRLAHEDAQRCRSCNLCFEDGSTFARVQTRSGGKRGTVLSSVVTPLANCTCIDCPTTFNRHRLREKGIEAISLCETMDW
jgi:DNA polymerase zeta